MTFFSRFQVAAQTRILPQIDQTAILRKWIAKSPPLHLARLDVPGRHQRHLSIRLDIHGLEISDKRLVCACRHPDAYLATGIFKHRKIPLQAPDKSHLIRRFQQPRFSAAGDA